MRLLSRLLALALTSALPAFAQYSIANIKITGGAPYTDAEITTVSGFAPGQMLSHDSLAQGAQHLLDTGLFDDTQVTTAGQGKARTVVLELKPVPSTKLLPASFENFVWWTSEELTAAIHSRVPLFRGGLPEAGTTQDSVQTALQQLLAEKGVTATLSHTIVEPSTQHPVRVVNYRIDSPRIRIASASYTDLAPASATALQPFLTKLNNTPYNEGLTGYTIEDAMLRPLRNSGYINATLGAPQRSVAPTANGFDVTYAAHLKAGPKYTLGTVTVADNPVYTPADLTHDTAQFQTAKVNGFDVLTYTEGKIVAAFHGKGYMHAYITPIPTPDDTVHTVSYVLTPVPGEQYQLHAVTALNLDAAAQKEFDSGWHMKPNDIYNETYVAKFINNNTALQHLATYSASFQASADPNTHLVDLTITFIPGPTTR